VSGFERSSQQGPTALQENVPTDHLDHLIRKKKNIKLIDVVRFSELRFDLWKKGTTFGDLETKFGVNKRRAQRTLKRAVQNGSLFTQGRTNPQSYFPQSRHFEVV
jgi:hypothetical protein